MRQTPLPTHLSSTKSDRLLQLVKFNVSHGGYLLPTKKRQTSSACRFTSYIHLASRPSGFLFYMRFDHSATQDCTPTYSLHHTSFSLSLLHEHRLHAHTCLYRRRLSVCTQLHTHASSHNHALTRAQTPNLS